MAITDVRSRYSDLMTELKERLTAVDDAIRQARESEEKLRYLQAEFAFVQLRMICEIMALAALWAHSDLPLSSKIQKVWHADDMFSALERVNDRCFPHACSIEVLPSGHLKLNARREGLKRTDLKSLYGACGDALHRGTLKQLLGGEPRTYDMNVLLKGVPDIAYLLSEHMIMIPAAGAMLYCKLGKEAEAVEIFTAQAGRPFALPPDAALS